MKKTTTKFEYATKTYIKSLGGITRCYPLGKGQGVFRDVDAKQAKIKAMADGWVFEPLLGVGYDYNLKGRIYKICRGG